MKNPHKLLVEYTAPGIVEHAIPVIREWSRRGHHTLIMAASGDLPALRRVHDRLAAPGRIDYGTFRQPPDWSDVRALFNIIPAGPGPVFRDPRGPCGIPRVTINHGLTDKATTFPADHLGHPVGYNNVLLGCGPAMFRGSWETYIKKWPETTAALKVLPVGSPKTDVLFDGSYQRADVLRKLQLNPKRPTVLYAPTYQKEASLEQDGRAIIEALAGLEINLIVRLHHHSLNSSVPSAVRDGHNGRDWRAVMQDLARRHGNLRHVEGDSNPLFVAADLLVGDVSGACYEYILQDKPVVFYDVPDFFAVHGTAGVGYWGREAGRIVHSTTELAAAVREELTNPGRCGPARRKLITELVYQRGGAAQRSVDALLDLIEGRVSYPAWGPRHNLRMDLLLQAYLRERLARCARETPALALFGAGVHARHILNLIRSTPAAAPGPQIRMILDDAPTVNNLENIRVVRPCRGQASEIDAVILTTDYHQAGMRRRCAEIFGPSLPVIDLYAEFPWHRPGPDANLENHLSKHR